MKKISILSLLALFFVFHGFSQTSYIVSGPTNAQGPLLNTESTSSSTGWTQIHLDTDHGGASVNSWSSAVNIGFPFDFYGNPVDSFCVSKNFLLTFSTGLATTALPAGINDNSALPAAALPDSTVAYQWDNFGNPAPIGSNDDVWVKTFGTTPNRQLWIKNFSYEINGSSFVYNYMVLEETSNNIYVVDARNGTNGSGSRTVGVQLNGTTAVQHASSPNITATVANVTSPWPNINYYQLAPFALVANNVGVVSIDSPGDGCGLTATEIVSITAENIGTASQSSIPVFYRLNGGAATSAGTIAGPLNSLTSTTHTFTLDLSGVQVHNLEVWTAHAGDAVTNNDTATATIENIPVVNTFPYAESFESGSGSWSAGGTNSSWALGAPAATVINSASDGTQAWVTNLTGQYSGGEQSYVQGPCFDLTTITDPEIIMDVWWQSETSWDGANLQSSTNGGATWSDVGSITSGGTNWYNDGTINGLSANGYVPSGDGWSGSGANSSGGWVTAQHDLTGLGTQSSVLLRVTFGADGGGLDEGFAFDNIKIRQKPLNDAGVASIDSPSAVCGANVTDSVSITITNAGANKIGNIPISYSVNGGTYMSAPNSADSIDAGMTGTYKFEVTLGAVGVNTISVATNYGGDPDNSNDTTSGTITAFQNVAAFPYTESFETGSGGWASGGTNSSWALGAPAATTINSASDGSQAWSTNLTGQYNGNEQSFVLSPCFDFSTIGNPEIVMDVWWESETSWDGANLQSSIDGGSTWADVGSISSGGTNWYNDGTINGLSANGYVPSGDGWSASPGSGGWVTASHDLTGLASQSSVQLRVTFGADGGGFGDGFAFDNVNVRDKPLHNLAISQILSPGDGCGLGMENVSVVVENFGAASQSAYSVGFRVNGGAAVTEIFGAADSVPALDTIHLNLAGLMDLSTPGANAVEVWTILAGDQDTSNDTLSLTITHETNVVNTFPYLVDHEALSNGNSGSLANGWTTSSTTGNFGWEIEDANGSNEHSSSTGPFYDHTTEGVSGGKYLFMETSSGATGEEDNLTSECIDLSALANPALEFWYHMYGSNMGSLVAEINSGGTWITLQTITGQQQTAGGDAWLNSVIDLAAYNGQSVKLRFRGVKGNGFRSDMALDDIKLFDIPVNDAGITAMDEPVGPIITAGTQNVKVSIKNFGVDTLVSAIINWNVNGVAQSAFNWTGSLAKDSTEADKLIGSYNFGAGLTELQFYTSMPNGFSDDETSNDTLETFLCTPLTGTYTVGPTGDFANLNDVANALTQCGVSSPVIVNVQMGAGPFNGQVLFGTMAGVSSTNTITFNGNGSIIEYAANSGDRRIVGFDGAKHITFDNFVINSLAADGYGIHLMNASDTNTISNCVINVSTSSTSSVASGGIITSGSASSMTTDGNSANYCTFSNNTINGGYYGIALNGASSTTRGTSNQVLNNTIGDFYHNGISLDEMDSTLVEGNDISRATRTSGTTFEGITLESGTGNRNNIISKNRIHNTHDNLGSLTGTTYGIYSTGNDAPLGEENLFVNNIIDNFNSNGTIYAIYNTSSNGAYYYHNTISLDHSTATGGITRGFYQTTTASDIQFRNNLISVTRGGSGTKHCLYFNATGSTIISETNVLYMGSTTGTNHVGRYSTDFSTLATWQTANANAFDQGSFDANPLLVSPGTGNVIPNEASINSMAPDIGVTEDFNGVARGATPDFGALEFDVATTAAVGIEIIAGPTNAFCTLGSAESISLSFKNLGTAAITSINASFVVNGGAPTTETFGSLNVLANATDTVTFTGTANLSAFQMHTVRGYITLTGDTDNSNDTTSDFNINNAAPTPTPYFENFESLANEDNGVFNNGWTGNQTSDPRWEAEDASGSNENSTGTGPFVDHTLSPAPGGIYMFTETSSGATGQESEMFSPCIDLTGLTQPEVSFWYHMYGANMGNLFLDISTDGGNSWSAIDSLIGQQQTVQSDPWLQRKVSICAFSGVVNFQFRGQRGSSFTSDMSIDDFAVGNADLSPDTVYYCAGGSATLDVGMYDSYLWSTGDVTQTAVVTSAGTYTVTVTDNGCPIIDNIVVIANPLPSASIAATDITCNGFGDGTAIASSTTGTAPFNYMWSNANIMASISALTAGTYTVTITDANGCTDTSSATILDPSAIGASISAQTNVDCNGASTGSATAAGSGGTGTYTYSWSNGVTTDTLNNVAAGTYTVSITDANGCGPAVDSAIITEPTALGVSISSQTNADCNGASTGSATAAGSGGTGTYTYAWSNGTTTASISSVTAGTYTVSVTDANGCGPVTSTVTLTEPTAASVSITAQTNVDCNGASTGSATAAGSGGTGAYTYAWSNGDVTATITGVTAGTYTVSVTDANGCGPATSSLTITEPTAVGVSITAQSNINCNGGATGSATSAGSGGTGAYTYAWSNGDVTASITNVAAGTYTVSTTDANGCGPATTTVTITEATAIMASTSKTDVSCNGLTDGAASVSGSGGTAPLTYAWSTGGTTSSITGLAAGTYTVSLTDANGCGPTTATAVVTEPVTLTSSISTSTNVSCNGLSDGSATASGTGGTSPYTYAWSDGATTAINSGIVAGSYTVTITDANGCSDNSSITITEPTTLSANTVSTNVTVFGTNDGAINLTVSGGTMAYTYAWSNGGTTEDLSSLFSGTYTVTVTDANGCTASTSANVTEPGALNESGITTDVTCNGFSDGAVDLTVTGGVTPYTYAWSNSDTTQDLTNVTAGTYTVTVTDNNSATISGNYTVSEPTTLVSSAMVDNNVSCNGFTDGGATASATGGTMPYGYLWSNGDTSASITNVVAGTYTITITDGNGCTDSGNATITEPTVLASSITSSANVSCNGLSDGSATAAGSGGTSPYDYVWSNGDTVATISNVSAGTYLVTITDANSCSNLDSAVITEPMVMAAAVVIDSNISCNSFADGGATASATGGTMPYTYTWSNAATTASITSVTAGTYTVTITDANNCSDIDSATISEPTALVVASVNDSNISCNGLSDGGATASATGGTMPYTYSWSNSATTASITGVIAGTYSVTITDANGCNDTTSVIIAEPMALVTATVVDSSALCFGFSDGGATASATGGTMPYTYVWSNAATTASITGLAAGTYSVTITDSNGCTGGNSAVITEPDSIQIVLASTDVNCNGGNDGSIAASIGSSGLTVWSEDFDTFPIDNVSFAPGSEPNLFPNGWNNLLADIATQDWYGRSNSTGSSNTGPNSDHTGGGVYVFIEDGFGNFNDIILETPQIDLTNVTAASFNYWAHSRTTVTSNFNELHLDVFHGGAWILNIDSFANLSTTDLWVERNIDISAYTGGMVTFRFRGDNSGTSFQHDIAIDDVSITAPLNFSYLWSNGDTTSTADSLVAGTYMVTVTTDDGCTASDSVTISEPTLLVVTANLDSSISCNGANDGGATANVMGGTMPYDYNWSNGDTTATITNLASGTYTIVVTDTNGCSATDSVVVVEPFALTVAIAIDSTVSCNGFSDGGASPIVSGGTMPYTYSWSNASTTASITGVVAGTYSLTVTDMNGCNDTASIVITEPMILVPSAITNNDVSCNGLSDGDATASATGGTSPYTYTWSNAATTANITGIAAGTYTVTISDANGCDAIDSTTVTEPMSLISSAVVDSMVTCNGQSDGGATASATGGTSPYTYNWSNSATTASITGVTGGTYNVTITDANGCTDSSSVNISAPNAIAANISSTNVSCNGLADGNAATATSGGTSPYTYLWSGSPVGQGTDSISGLIAGTYHVTISDANGCMNIDSAVITEPAAILTTVSQSGFTLTADMAAATSYQWLDCNNGNTAIAGATMQSYTVTANGSYAVEITVGACVDTSACTVVLNVGLADINQKDSEWTIYPNPTNGSFTFNVNGVIGEDDLVRIYNIAGELVVESPLNSTSQQIDMSSFGEGVYIIRYKDQIKKLVVTN